jgi:hypothetical protein
MRRAEHACTTHEDYMAPNASILVTLGIPSLAIATLALIAFMIQRAARDGGRYARLFVVGAAAWLAFSGALAASGFLARFDMLPPPFVMILVPTLVLPLWLARSRVGELLCDRAPLAWLVGFQAFRLPLELVMHRAGIEGTMPVQMSFGGSSFDIVSGITAIAVAALAAYDRAPRWLIMAWNALGSLLLLNIVCIAIASLPQFHRFGSDPAQLNTWVAYFPFVWLPAGLVTSALFGHALLWRKLVRDARGATSGAPRVSAA